MDGVERAVAVPAEKEAAREGGPELGGGQPGDGVDVVAADEAQKEGPHSPGISCPPSADQASPRRPAAADSNKKF